MYEWVFHFPYDIFCGNFFHFFLFESYEKCDFYLLRRKTNFNSWKSIFAGNFVLGVAGDFKFNWERFLKKYQASPFENSYFSKQFSKNWNCSFSARRVFEIRIPTVRKKIKIDFTFQNSNRNCSFAFRLTKAIIWFWHCELRRDLGYQLKNTVH